MDKGRKSLPCENYEMSKSVFSRLGKEKKFQEWVKGKIVQES